MANVSFVSPSRAITESQSSRRQSAAPSSRGFNIISGGSQPTRAHRTTRRIPQAVKLTSVPSSVPEGEQADPTVVARPEDESDDEDENNPKRHHRSSKFTQSVGAASGQNTAGGD